MLAKEPHTNTGAAVPPSVSRWGSHTLAWTSVQGQGVQTVQTVSGQIGRLRGGFCRMSREQREGILRDAPHNNFLPFCHNQSLHIEVAAMAAGAWLAAGRCAASSSVLVFPQSVTDIGGHSLPAKHTQQHLHQPLAVSRNAARKRQRCLAAAQAEAAPANADSALEQWAANVGIEAPHLRMADFNGETPSKQ